MLWRILFNAAKKVWRPLETNQALAYVVKGTSQTPSPKVPYKYFACQLTLGSLPKSRKEIKKHITNLKFQTTLNIFH